MYEATLDMCVGQRIFVREEAASVQQRTDMPMRCRHQFQDPDPRTARAGATVCVCATLCIILTCKRLGPYAIAQFRLKVIAIVMLNCAMH